MSKTMNLTPRSHWKGTQKVETKPRVAGFIQDKRIGHPMKLIHLQTNGDVRLNARANSTARGGCGWWPSFNATFVCFVIGAFLCGLLSLGDASPIAVKAGWNAVMSGLGANVRRPQNQLQADARTLVAAVRYLLQPEPEFANERGRTYYGWEPFLIDTQAVTATAMLASNASRL
jgi:hypothetical protein